MYTGDDFNFAALIGGDGEGHSDALLGIFDAIAPAASAALAALAQGDRATLRSRSSRRRCRCRATSSRRRRASTRPASCFMAWLNGHQSHFTMVGGQQSARSLVHLAELFRLADAAGLLRDPDLAGARMRTLLARARHRRLNERRPIPRCCRSTRRRCVRSGRCRQIIDGCARHGIRGISPWRDQVAAAGLADTAQRIRDAGLDGHRLVPRRHVSRAPTATGRRAALDDNRRAVDEALRARRALPRARRRRPAEGSRAARSCRRTSTARARWCATASASCSTTRAPPACRSRSSRCIRCTPPTARA